MKVVYTATALGDLRNIARYVTQHSSNGAKHIRSDIQAAIESAALFPFSGRRNAHDTRKLVTRKYKYVIYYTIDIDRGAIQIVSIFHPAQNRSGVD